MELVDGHVVLDISSDEEGGCGGVGDYDWLAELLSKDDLVCGDSDEVVVVKEVNAKSKLDKLTNLMEDDDCVVLEGEQERSVAAPDHGADESSDDLLIVGEKGQVACRDYPHPRHDCVQFPFGTTSHEKHCNLCYCYVCDSPAPCAYWGKGLSDIDHCHASNKQEKWKTCRNNLKLGINTPIPVSSIAPTSVSNVLPQSSQVLLPRNSQPLANVIPQNLVAVGSHSPLTRSSALDNVPHSKRHHSGNISMSRFQPLSVTPQLQRVHNGLHKDRVLRESYLGPCHAASKKTYKRPATVGSSLALGRSSYGPNNCLAPTLQHSDNSMHKAIVNRNHIRRHNVPRSSNLMSSTSVNCSPPNFIGISPSMVPSQSIGHLQGSNHLTDGQYTYQHQSQSQPTTFSSLSDGLSWVQDLLLADESPSHQPALQSPYRSVDSVEPMQESQPVGNLNSDFGGSLDLGATSDFDHWLLDNQPQESAFSSEPPAIDAGMLLFDFETSWNSVTQS